jgi:spore germination cell wall hydrolase CwlJ-like protein
MTFSVPGAVKTAAIVFAAAFVSAQPALAADAAAAVPSVTPGFEQLETALTPGDVLATPEGAISEPVAAEPEAPQPERRTLAQLVQDHASADPRDAQADCLASAVYFESNGEPFAGQLAVAEVIINRARSGRFASTLCGVITQRSQFSFVRAGRIPNPPRHTAAWRNAVAIAHIAIDDLADSPVSTALFFHARYVSPRWRLQRLASVGNHIFYR